MIAASGGIGGLLTDLANAQLTIGEQHILWREIVGNAFGLASSVGGMRRRVWAWPVGVVGNVLLFTVFLGAAFGTPQHANLLGQAGRQVVFVLVAIYGWRRWRTASAAGEAAVTPRWATWRERAGLAAVAVVSVAVLTWLFRLLGSYEPVWADAWIFTGSMLATYSMARGWVDFWLIWIGVDVVGVPLLLRAHLYPSATLYMVYGAFVVWGFTVWLRTTRTTPQAPSGVPIAEEVGR
jgi:nicotinamide mononucleotide transporter